MGYGVGFLYYVRNRIVKLQVDAWRTLLFSLDSGECPVPSDGSFLIVRCFNMLRKY